MSTAPVRILGPDGRPLPTARERAAERAMRMMAAGYTGASTARRQTRTWDPGTGSANSDSLSDLPSLRGRSRDLERNFPLAAGALNTAVTNIVGTGLMVQPQLDRELLGLTDEEADAWERQAKRLYAMASLELDITRKQDGEALQDLVLRSILGSGDIVVIRRFKLRPGDLFGTKVQLVEADRVSNPSGKPDSLTLTAGVEIDADGADVAYHIADVHPGEYLRSPTKWSRVVAFGGSGERQAMLLFHRRRPGQVRGIPYLAPVIETLHGIGKYTDNELMAAVVASMFTVFLKTAGGAEGGLVGLVDDSPQADPTREVKLGSGAVVELGENEDVAIADPKRPNQAFDGFLLAMARYTGVALEIPYELLVKHFTASYSAARAALLEAWKFFRTRREWLAAAFCQPVYEWVITEAIGRGYLEAAGFWDSPLLRRAWLGATWTGPSPGQLDPLKEIQAAKERIALCVSTLAEETAQITGGDWDTIVEQRAKEQARLKAAELTPTQAAPSPAPAPPPPAQENQDGTDSDLEDETQP